MPREVELSLNEQTFILDALREDTRLDGRSLDAFRDMELAFGDEYGAADVRLGKTRSDHSHTAYRHVIFTVLILHKQQSHCQNHRRGGRAIPRSQI